MRVGMTQHKTTRLGGHESVRVSDAAALQIEMLYLEGNMGILGQILRIDYHIQDGNHPEM